MILHQTNFAESFASGSEDKNIKLWNLNTGKLMLTLNVHSGVVNSVAFSDRQIFASSSGIGDNTARI